MEITRFFYYNKKELLCQAILFSLHSGYAYSKIIATAERINKNPKLNAENNAMYFPVPLGSCLVYSLNVIRLAREEISVPTPPIFTPNKREV